MEEATYRFQGNFEVVQEVVDEDDTTVLHHKVLALVEEEKLAKLLVENWNDMSAQFYLTHCCRYFYRPVSTTE